MLRHSIQALVSALVLALASVLGLPAAADEPTIAIQGPGETPQAPLELSLAGVHYIPHVKGQGLTYQPEPDGPLGARIQFFVVNTGRNPVTASEAHFNNSYPKHHLYTGAWSWHDTPNGWPGRDRVIPPGAMSVWTINAVHKTWEDGQPFEVRVHDWSHTTRPTMVTELRPPRAWLAAVTFLGDDPRPDEVVVHIENQRGEDLHLKGIRLWQPESRSTFRALYPGDWYEELASFHPDGIVPAGDAGGFSVAVDPLMLSYAAVEVRTETADGEEHTLWGYLRVKREVFDIAGGWTNAAAADGRSTMLHEPFLKALRRLHVNAAHIPIIPGYNDAIGSGGLYDQYPIKFFYHLNPIEHFDTDEMIAHVHGAEFLGEPQLPFSDQGLLPQQVWQAFQPFARTRIPTTITLSDEAGWRLFAGLSDYPHYDAYRVIAPHADPWTRYDRWENGVRIGWGSPVETISEMNRVLRELSRPAPMAIWSQGPNTGWYVMDGRTRLSPTPEELLSQAYLALSTRITSLYWFNLSLGSLLEWRDLYEPMARLGREMRMLESFYLRGNAYRHEIHTRFNRPDWELASIVAPHGAVLFANDLDYYPDLDERVFQWGEPRPAVFEYALPAYMRGIAEVFRVDADGLHPVEWEETEHGVRITTEASLAAVFVAAPDGEARAVIEAAHAAAIADEEALAFEPATNDNDFAALQAVRR